MVYVVVVLLIATTSAFKGPLWPKAQHHGCVPFCDPDKDSLFPALQLSVDSNGGLEFQSQCGRGQDHLSAFLEEGDVVVYQTGTWLLDGVQVGDGDDPEFCMAQMETMQVVWTHNCEHGVIRGYAMTEQTETMWVLTDEAVEFGPEQLVARVPVEWTTQNDSTDQPQARSFIPLTKELWLGHLR